MARTSSLQFSPFAVTAAPVLIIPFSANTWVLGLANSSLEFSDMHVDDDGNIYATGIDNTVAANSQMFVMKFNSRASLQWAYVTTPSTNATASVSMRPTGITVTNDGTVCCGFTTSNSSNFGTSRAGMFALYASNGAVRGSSPLVAGDSALAAGSRYFQLGQTGAGAYTQFGTRTGDVIVADPSGSGNRVLFAGWTTSGAGYNEGVLGMAEVVANGSIQINSSAAQGGPTTSGNSLRANAVWANPLGVTVVLIDSMDSGSPARGPQIWQYNTITSPPTFLSQKAIVRSGVTSYPKNFLLSITGNGSNVFVSGASTPNNSSTTYSGTIWSAAITGTNATSRWTTLYTGGLLHINSVSAEVDGTFLYAIDSDGFIARLTQANGSVNWARRLISGGGRKVIHKNGGLYICLGTKIIKTDPSGSELVAGANLAVGWLNLRVNTATISTASNTWVVPTATQTLSNTLITLATNTNIYSLANTTHTLPRVALS